MPVVILLDVSLSMCCPVVPSEGSEEYQLRNLAVLGLNTFLDQLAAQTKLEFVSLVIFSSLWEIVVPFTRDLDKIRKALDDVDSYDKTCIMAGLSGVASAVHEEWGSQAPCQVILVTDGATGVGEECLKSQLARIEEGDTTECPLPFSFPCNLYVTCLGSASDAQVQTSIHQYEQLVGLTGQPGKVYSPEGPVSLKSVQQMFSQMTEENFTPYCGTLQCGNLKCSVQLMPPPKKYVSSTDFEQVRKELSPCLSICGFLDVPDLGSPPYISRHLVLPVSSGKSKTDQASQAEEDEDDDGKTPAFTVLLHGSLKVESMVALVEIGPDWYGCLYSWADTKKKSNLMLSVFQPGVDVIPWLGNIKHLAPCGDFAEPPYNDDSHKSPFPVRPTDRRSYALNCVVWIKQASLQADIQKVLRHARKLPEKQQNFYKELNRVRRAALSYGFHDLLEAMASLLERECQLLPGNAHPDAALQLTHAANMLRAETVTDYSVNILPMSTNFTEGE